MTTEQNIIRAAKAGKEAAFEELVTAYEKKVYQLAFRYTGNEFDAFDVSQEVFLRVFRFLPQFNEQSKFSTWLYRIAVNVCKDFVHKRKMKNEISLEMPDDDDENGFVAEIPDLRFNPETEAERRELRDAIADGIESLPERHREILILRDVVGLSYDEIGSTLALEQGTVKSRIARARDRLRAFLSDGGNFSGAPQSKEATGRRDK